MQNSLLVALSGNAGDQSPTAPDIGRQMDSVLEQIASVAGTFGTVFHAVTGIDTEIDAKWQNALYREGKAWKTTVTISGRIEECNRTRIESAEKAGAMFLEFPDVDNTHRRDEAVAAYSDMLVVVWDGDEGGDTARLVRHFILLRKPVIWLKPGMAGTRVNYSRLEILDHSTIAALECDDLPINSLFGKCNDGLIEALPGWLKHLELGKHSLPSGRVNGGGFINKRHGWWDKLFRCAFVPASRRSLVKLITLKPLISPWRGKAFERNPDPEELSAAFDMSDTIASEYAGIYRSTSVLAYLLSACAIISAIGGILTHAAAWAWLEIITILLILLLIKRAKQNNVHDHFIKSRMEAELIRYHRMLLPLLGVSQVLNSPHFDVDDNGNLKSVFPEMLHLRRLIANSFNVDNLLAPGKTNNDLKAYLSYLKGVVEEQAEYHSNRKVQEHSLHHRLHLTTQSAFFLTLVAVGLHVIDVTFGLHWQFGSALSALAIGMPAVAAALHGILVQTDAEKIAHQSDQMASALKRHAKRLNDVSVGLESATDGANYHKNLDILRRNAVQIADLMINEAQEWRSGIELHAPSLPA